MAGLTKKQLADNLGRLLNRKITSNHITAWEHETMPGWDAGEAISMITGKNVTAQDVNAKATNGKLSVRITTR